MDGQSSCCNISVWYHTFKIPANDTQLLNCIGTIILFIYEETQIEVVSGQRLEEAVGEAVDRDDLAKQSKQSVLLVVHTAPFSGHTITGFLSRIVAISGSLQCSILITISCSNIDFPILSQKLRHQQYRKIVPMDIICKKVRIKLTFQLNTIPFLQ